MYAISYKKHYVAFEGTYATQIYATFNCKKSHEGVVSTVDRILARDDGAFVTYLELKCTVEQLFGLCGQFSLGNGAFLESTLLLMLTWASITGMSPLYH